MGNSTGLIRNWWLTAFVAVLVLGAAACGGEETVASSGGDTEAAGPAETAEGSEAVASSDPGDDQEAQMDCDEPIRVGTLSPMSGQYATWGEGWTNAAKLAIDQWNEDGGVLGCEVEGLYEDTQGDPEEGVNAANKLVSEGVVGVAGPIFSGVTLAAGPILNDAGIPFLIGSSNIEISEQGWDTMFRIAFSEDQSGPFDAQTALDQGWQNCAVVHDNTAFAKGLAEQFTGAFEEGGGTVETSVITPGESDYSATLTSIREGDFDCVYFSGYYAEGGQFVRQGKELGLTDVGWLFGNSNQDPEFIEIAGDAAEGILMGTWPPPTAQAETSELAADYVERYEAAYDETPSSLYHWAYDGVKVILETIEETGSRDPAEIAAAIHEGAFEGTSGELVFDERGDREEQPLGVLTVENGEFVQADSP